VKIFAPGVKINLIFLCTFLFSASLRNCYVGFIYDTVSIKKQNMSTLMVQVDINPLSLNGDCEYVDSVMVTKQLTQVNEDHIVTDENTESAIKFQKTVSNDFNSKKRPLDGDDHFTSTKKIKHFEILVSE